MILLNVQQYCKTEQGIRSVLLTTAVPVSKEIKDELCQKIDESYQCTTELSEKVDEDIIGGFVLQIDVCSVQKMHLRFDRTPALSDSTPLLPHFACQ